MKKYFNKKGSTLLMILIMTAVLSVLGAVALSMSLMNLNMKYNDARAKKTMYYSESGIDQVSAYVDSRVEKSLGEARQVTDSYLEGLKKFLEDDEDGKVSVGEFINYEEVDEDGNTVPIIKSGPIINASGEIVEFYTSVEEKLIDDEAIEEVTNDFFKEEFAKKFDSENNSIKSYIETNISGIQANGNQCSITVGSVDEFGFGDTFTLNQVKSLFNYNDEAEKEISVDIVVNMPDNLYPFKKIQNTVAVEDNPIWQNALVSNSNIIFNSGTSTIKGDVYAFGKATSTYDNSGIKIGGIVNLTGDMVSLSYIQTAAANAELNTDHGVIYCNSLVTKKGTDGSEINVQGNVYTEDDLELDADGSKINIEGSYYGMSDGSASSTHDKSSSIIINAALDNVNTKLKITGDVWIPGTAYVNLTGEGDYWPYQTGESLSVKGNYRAYTIGLDSSELRLNKSNVIWATSQVDGKDGPKFAVGYTSPTPKDYTVDDKSEYFLEAFAEHSELFNYGNSSIEIGSDKYQYVLGTVPVIDNNKLELKQFTGNIVLYKEMQSQIVKQYLYYLNNTTSGISSTDDLASLMDTEKYTFDILEKRTNLKSLTGFKKEISESKDPCNDETHKATEVLLICNNTDDVIINAHQLELADDDTNDIKSASTDAYGYMQGVIITQGNVIINGDINFTGVIIAGGDITVNGSNNEFHNSETSSIHFLIDFIRKHTDLRSIFNKDIDKLIQYYEEDILNTDNNNNVNSYKDFVLMKNWKLD